MMMGFGILVIAVLGIIVWQLINPNNNTNTNHKRKRKVMSQTAQDIVYERYANDEITHDEYLTMLEDIEEANQQYQ